MVGEIRDSDTARVAIQAALTGHLVLSTVHTKDCVGALARLTDMGVEPYLLASALNGVVAQRLARTVCSTCRTTYMPDRTLLVQAGWDRQGPHVFYRGEGCKKCHDSGFQGRVGIYEVVEMTDELYKLVHDVADESAIKRHLLTQGFLPLRQQGLALVESGKSTLEEVLRVTHMESHETVRAERKRVSVTAGA